MQQQADQTSDNPAPGKGQVLTKEPHNKIAADKRNTATADAIERIQQGHTLREIAADHGIHWRTLQNWLYALGDEHAQARRTYVDSRLIEASEYLDKAIGELEEARDPTLVPRARGMVEAASKRWAQATWYAERIDRARYGQQPQASKPSDMNVTINITPIQPNAVVQCTQPKTLESEPVTIDGQSQVIDS